MKPHPHRDVIIDFANGYQIQWFEATCDRWMDWSGNSTPSFSPDIEYRRKPEPKPDVVHYINSYPLYAGYAYPTLEVAKKQAGNINGIIKRTISGETGKLIAVELVKD